jgi:hypothetical protein
MTVRELIAALARTEEELRRLRDPVRVCTPEEDPVRRRIETAATQGRIVRELRFRRRSSFAVTPHPRPTRVGSPDVE